MRIICESQEHFDAVKEHLKCYGIEFANSCYIYNSCHWELLDNSYYTHHIIIECNDARSDPEQSEESCEDIIDDLRPSNRGKPARMQIECDIIDI